MQQIICTEKDKNENSVVTCHQLAVVDSSPAIYLVSELKKMKKNRNKDNITGEEK